MWQSEFHLQAFNGNSGRGVLVVSLCKILSLLIYRQIEENSKTQQAVLKNISTNMFSETLKHHCKYNESDVQVTFNKFKQKPIFWEMNLYQS